MQSIKNRSSKCSKVLYNGVLLCISSQVCDQTCHVGSLKGAVGRACAPRKLAHVTNQDSAPCSWVV